MLTKAFRLQVKTGESTAEGTFTGLLSTYGNVDRVGDAVERGAFTKTLQENGGVVPMLWGHNMMEPIGTLALKDAAEGLEVEGTLILEVQRAREAYALLQKGAIRGLSIGYETVKAAGEKGYRKLKELKLYEGSLVAIPANPLAMITSVKAFADDLEEIKAGRRLSKQSIAYLEAAIEALSQLRGQQAREEADEKSIDIERDPPAEESRQQDSTLPDPAAVEAKAGEPDELHSIVSQFRSFAAEIKAA